MSVRATTQILGSSRRFPGHEEDLTIPGEPLVFSYYAGRGVQLQPFETLKEGMRALNQPVPDLERARAIADRLIELSQRNGTVITWEYFFPFGGPSRPWTSAISQGLATEFFHRLSVATPTTEGLASTTYAQVAEGVTRSLLTSSRRGGVATPEGRGSFYVMYSFHPNQRILNGHLQVLLNTNRYAQATGSPLAAKVVRDGLAAVLPMLPRFDTGSWSNYQLGQEADLEYHEFQTGQLVKLGKELNEPTLAAYGERFDFYLTTPPTLVLPTTNLPPIIGAPDGYRDTVRVPFTIDKRARVTMVIERASDGSEVQRVTTWVSKGRRAIAWNGRTARGARAASGAYVARVVATDVAGNRTTSDLAPQLMIEADTVAPLVRLLTVRSAGRGTLVTASAFDASSGWITVELRRGRTVLAQTRIARSGTARLRVARTQAQLAGAVLVLRDSSGNVLMQPLATG
jgi:hypothetical protein